MFQGDLDGGGAVQRRFRAVSECLRCLTGGPRGFKKVFQEALEFYAGFRGDTGPFTGVSVHYRGLEGVSEDIMCIKEGLRGVSEKLQEDSENSQWNSEMLKGCFRGFRKLSGREDNCRPK